MTPPLILIVDDESSLRNVVGRLLRSAGYRTHEATNLLEAASILEKEPVDRVLLDLVLGDDNGWEGLRGFVERFGARVVLMTGTLVDDDTLQDARLLGAVGVLQKPFSRDELLRVLPAPAV